MNLQLTQLGPNQTRIAFESLGDQYFILFSYSTPVAASIRGKYYKTKTKFSKTTSKHISTWLDGREAEEKEQEFFDNLVK